MMTYHIISDHSQFSIFNHQVHTYPIEKKEKSSYETMRFIIDRIGSELSLGVLLRILLGPNSPYNPT